MIFKNKEEIKKSLNLNNPKNVKLYNDICRGFLVLEDFKNFKEIFLEKLTEKESKNNLLEINFDKQIFLYNVLVENTTNAKKEYEKQIENHINQIEKEKSIKKNNLNNIRKELGKDYLSNIKINKNDSDAIILELKSNKLNQIKILNEKEPSYILEKQEKIFVEKEKLVKLKEKIRIKEESLNEIKQTNIEQLNLLKNQIENTYEHNKSLIKANHRKLIDYYNPIVLKLANEEKESIKVFDNNINTKIYVKQQEIKELEKTNQDNILSINIKENKELLKTDESFDKQKEKHIKKQKDINDKYINEQKILEEKKLNLHDGVSLEKIEEKFKKLKKNKDNSILLLEKEIEKDKLIFENKKDNIHKKYEIEKNKIDFLYKKDKQTLLKELKNLNDEKGNLVEDIKNIYELKKFNIYNQFILHSNFDDKNIGYHLNQKSLDLSLTEHTIKKNELNYKIDILKNNLDYDINSIRIENEIKKHILNCQKKFLIDKMLIDLYNHKFFILTENLNLNHEKYRITEKNKLYNQIDQKEGKHYLEVEELEKNIFSDRINLLKKYNGIFNDLINSYFNNYLYNLKNLIENEKKSISVNISFFETIFKNYYKNINEMIKNSKNLYNFLQANKQDLSNIKIENFLSNNILEIKNFNIENIKETRFLSDSINLFIKEICNFKHDQIDELNKKILKDITNYYNLIKNTLNENRILVNIKYNEYNNYKNRKLSIKTSSENNFNHVNNLKSVVNKEITLINKKISSYESILDSFKEINYTIDNLYKLVNDFNYNLLKIINDYLNYLKEKSNKELNNNLNYYLNILKEIYIEKYNLIVENNDDIKYKNKLENISKQEIKISTKINNIISNYSHSLLSEVSYLNNDIEKYFEKYKNNIKIKKDFIIATLNNLKATKISEFKSFKYYYESFIKFKISKFNERKIKKIKDLDIKLSKNKLYIKNFEKLLKSKEQLINKNTSDVLNYNETALQSLIKSLLSNYNLSLKKYQKQIIDLDNYYEEVKETIEKANDDLLIQTQTDLKKAIYNIKNKYNLLKKDLLKSKRGCKKIG